MPDVKGWVVVQPDGSVEWWSARASEAEAMEACFGRRERDRYPRDWWQHQIDAGWRCVELSSTPPADPNSWEENVRSLLDGCSATLRCCEGGGPEDLKGSLVLTFGRIQSRLDAARTILDGISEALESRGFVHMTNGDSIGKLLDDAERVRARAGVVAASASERFPDGRQAVDGPALARLALALTSPGGESGL